MKLLTRNLIKISLLFLPLFSFAQDPTNPNPQRFDEYHMQPEVWHISEPVFGDVTATGDLTLSLPVMTVPGRGGFDYNVNLFYRSSIQYYAQASWIGLGWNFDPGSITMDVVGWYDESVANDAQKDAFYVTLPGKGTMTMYIASDSSSYTSFKNWQTGSDGFFFEEYKPYKVKRDMAGNQITGFVIVDDSGFRYLFGMPSKVCINHGYASTAQLVINNAWRLLAIMGPEVDHSNNLSNVSGLNSTVAGRWIKFEYRFNAFQDFNYSDYDCDKVLPQTTYLYKVITPTHTAIFNTGTMEDCDLLYKRYQEAYLDVRNKVKRLDTIILHEYNTSTQLKKVKLVSDYSLAKFEPRSGGPGNYNDPYPYGKLTLREIQNLDTQDSIISRHKFEYNGFNPGWVAHKSYHYYDGFGYYNDQNGMDAEAGIDSNTVDGTAWCLSKIIYPTGGWEEYRYENDKFDGVGSWQIHVYDTDNNNHPSLLYLDFDNFYGGTCRRQGGARIASITRNTKETIETISINYGLWGNSRYST